MKKETNRSRQAALTEHILDRIIIPKGATLTEAMMEFRRFRGKRKQYSLPLFFRLQDNIETVTVEDMQLFYMNVESTSNYLIIYLHGGAYVEEILPFHWLMLDKLSQKVNSTFIVPDYPLAPYHNFRDAYDRLTILYLKCLKYYHDRKIVLMGDSAGGGLALGLCQYWDTIGLKQPYRLILLSPWVDLTMKNPDIPEYEKNDPSLIRDELLVDAYYWADGTDLKDRRLSPIYGDMSIYKRVSLFVGTHEMFYPDITLLARKLEDAGARVDLNIGEGLNHVYPAYPIPEADKALKHIEKLLL